MPIAVAPTFAELWLQDPAVRQYIVAGTTIVAVLIILAFICLRLRLLQLRHRLRDLHTDTRATATIEFALVAPVLLSLVLMLVQIMLLVTGNYYVHYAAYAATRAGVVQVPLTTVGERRNEVINEPGNAKYDAIRRAARFAVVPAAGRLRTGSAPTTAYVEGIDHHFAAYGQTTPGWVQNVAADQLNYAYEYTHLDVMVTIVYRDDAGEYNVRKLTVQEHVQAEIDDGNLPVGTPLERWTFGDHAPITMRVQHELAVTLPYVGVLFSDGTHAAQTASGLGRYTLVTADYTLNNEGIANELPPLPPVPRDP